MDPRRHRWYGKLYRAYLRRRHADIIVARAMGLVVEHVWRSDVFDYEVHITHFIGDRDVTKVMSRLIRFDLVD